MSTSTLTSKGQTTVPKDIRDHLKLEPGDRIEFLLDELGRVFLVPAKLPLASLAGSLRNRAKKHPITLEEMDQAIAAGASASTIDRSSGLASKEGGRALGDRAAEGAPAKRGRAR